MTLVLFFRETLPILTGINKIQNTYKQREDGLFICIKFVDANGSLLRNINKKSNTGNATVDDAVNSAMESSKLGLSLTIYNDLLNGSLVGIPESK